jgi:hypothetical protein
MENHASLNIFEEIFHKESDIGVWPTPESRDFSELSDPLLFSEVLEIAEKEGYVSVEKLMSESEGLRNIIRRLWVVERPTKTTIEGIFSAMKSFGWLEESRAGSLKLTPDGVKTYHISNEDKKYFRRILLEKMHSRYVIPGWIVSRLLALNCNGQGEIVLPSPLKEWQPEPVKWENRYWTEDLEFQTIRAAETANRVFPGSFPIDNIMWVNLVKSNWDKLSTRARRRVAKLGKKGQPSEEKPKINTYSPRGRLSQAMREAAIELLFSAYYPVKGFLMDFQLLEFRSEKLPIPPRAFGAWAPRLEALELIFYTDSHPFVSGRLLFPCATFRDKADTPPFEIIRGVKDPRGRLLCLHQPTWDYIRPQFINILLDTYGRVSKRVGALYISLLDVRDEVCRQLRLSSTLFDHLLETAYRELIRENVSLGTIDSISLESDIRQEQRSGYGMLRRPVYINSIPHSLIAISRRHVH